MFGAKPRVEDCKARAGRGIRCRHAIVLAAGLVAGQLAIAPAAADFDSDNRDCFAQEYRGQKRVDACTRVIHAGRLQGHGLAMALQARAEGYRITEQYERALADFDRAIEIDPGVALMYANRAEAHRMLGHYDQVIADTTRAIRLDPSSNAFYAIRGMAYEKKNDLVGARADYKKALALPVSKLADGPWGQDVARARLKDLGD